MKHLRWQIIFGVSLISLSVIVYISQILIFKRPFDTGFYIFQDLAFVPISVLIVTLSENFLWLKNALRITIIRLRVKGAI